MDFDFGGNSEMLYECTTGADSDYNLKFSYSALDSVRDSEYTDSCRNCKNVFGGVSLNNKENVILNKLYSKEEFVKLRADIIKQMNDMPFIDKCGREYRYGEFFPVELSPWAYNETSAQEFLPLDKDEANKNGYPWRDADIKNFNITISADKIPDNINDVGEKILQEVLGCAHEGKCTHQCSTAFRLTDYELKFYKKHDIPPPILCSNCRFYERYKVMPALKLWKRSCMCDKSGHFHGTEKCVVDFETAYAPDRSEKLYCEKCYQQEV